ncbi:MAG: arginine repressor [Spirochaetales bacterium]|nr:arginine repressor [Spirochaetales bacterium]
MEDKIARHKAIKKIINSSRIDSQETLLKELESEGFNVTQATLSRDLRRLKVVKIMDGPDGYCYTFLENEAGNASDEALIEDFLRGFLSIEFSGNFGLIKTLPGHAHSVAFALDNLKISEILGTIAGDDTILIVPKDSINRKEILRALETKIPGLYGD